MELIVISENKFKIMLSEPDMRRYELNPEEMMETDDHTRRAFRHLLDDCGDIGRDTRGERLLVQVYSSKEGGCEIFVTKIEQGEGRFLDENRQPCKLTEGEKALRAKIMETEGVPTTLLSRDAPVGSIANDKTSVLTFTRSACFLFDHLQDAIRACRRLNGVGVTGGTCYILEGDRGVLIRLELPTLRDQRLDASVAFLYEYGREINEANGALYLCEHGKMLTATNAVSLLGSF